MEHPWFYRMDESGETPTTRATKSGERLLAEILLKQDREYAEFDKDADQGHVSKLHHAAYWGLTNAVRSLLQSGATPNERDEHGNSPLHHAARNGHYDTVEALIQHGADINAANDYGMTTLHWVALNGRSDIADLLLDYGAGVNPRDRYTDYQLTPMAMALLMGYTDLVEQLGARGGTC